MAEVIYERMFYQKGAEAWAMIVDYSDHAHIEFRFGITERAEAGAEKEMVTFQNRVEECCSGLPSAVRRTLWIELYQQAKGELNREIRIATDPHYDLPERETY